VRLEAVARTSGGSRRSGEIEPFGDPIEQVLDRTGTGQVQLDPVLVLAHSHREFEQLQDEGHRLRLRQFGMAQGVVTQAVDQAIGGAGIEQTQVVGEEAVIGGAVAGQIVFHRLDEYSGPRFQDSSLSCALS